MTHKIERKNFREMSKSYQRVPHFLTRELGTNRVPYKQLLANGKTIVDLVAALQRQFNVTSFLTPSLFVGEGDVGDEETVTSFSVGEYWLSEFFELKLDRPVVQSLCLAVECLRTPRALQAIEASVRERRPAAIYLMLFDFELGANPELDKAVFRFLRFLRSNGVRRIIYSHAPSWVYFLEPYGVTDFVSGANYLSTLKKEYLEREKDIGGIPHNYYIPKRFCRMTHAQAQEAIRSGLFDPCRCPACHGGVPENVNEIREHYIHVRSQECRELAAAKDRIALLTQWADQTEALLSSAEEKEIRVLGNPTPTLWREGLEG
ncbi:hypothetical protein [Polyangium mundeleinium]|uniref:Uncharacterized protein n=1 Tax=Polyangium mundeleinium TaxID=2995306 RepID=A0ABT5F7C2_9BACT|nr:hypothetical protein [Polyangium mundeleinium]MDC0750008.1 hypothetical protein [Polyangium mundeleinium]